MAMVSKKSQQKMAYIDLFAGPGRYDNQSKSTPLMVLETILADPDLASRMITMFNDKDAKNVESLQKAICGVVNKNLVGATRNFYRA
jgi:three-Cys-motif partner protein